MSQPEDMSEYEEMPRRGRLRPGQFLVVLSGARPEILARCPTERVKFQSLGWAILITSGMGTVSMWFALTSAMGINPIAALPIAIMWGLIIMGIDRWLVTSMPIDGKRKLIVAAPRLVLAVLLGTLISTPIVLRIFESEINNQISIIKETNEATFLNSQQHSSIQARVTEWQNEVNNLQQVIDSRGAKPLDPADDPIVAGLTTQLGNERKVAASDYKAWQCQLYGGCGAPQGDGVLAQASEKRYNADERQITSLTDQIATREQDLQATGVESQQSRLQQAQGALPNAQAQLKAAQGEESSLLGNFQSTNSSTNGLLIRLKALDQLSAGDSTLQMTRFLLFLLFLVIEILPVTVKLLQQPGNYEEILRTVTTRELKQAQWELRGGPGGAALDEDSLRPTAADAGLGGLGGLGRRSRGRRPRDPLDEDLTRMFERRTKVHPMPGWASSAPTSQYGTRRDDLTGPNPLNDRLREMTDTRPDSDGYDGRQGGVERLYRDDDL
jgi:hypothetical protein